MEQLETLRKFRNDPWAFATQCVFTLDPKDTKTPIKKFPAYLEYLHLYFRIWEKERLITVPKSRRMFMSWANLILYLHDTMFHIGRHNAFVSKKEEDADTLLNRCEFILKNIPKDVLPPELIPKWNKTYCNLEFPELNSKIQAFPSGSDQLRMHGFSGILNDEMAFQDNAKEMYASSFPTIENGGKLTAISSPAVGFFQQLVFDNMDEKPNRQAIISPYQGVEMWRNLGNKFFVFQTHYTADPTKRDPSYIANIKASMPLAQFRQEFELVWESFEGNAVYPDWNREIHGVKAIIKPMLGLPLFLGIDQGLSPAAVVAQIQGEELVIMKEYTADNMGAERFNEYVTTQLRRDYPGWPISKDESHWIVGMDPSGFNRRDVDERTYAAVWAKDFKVHPGENLWEKRRQSVERWLVKFRKGRPCLRVSIPNCPVTVEGFDGGFRYPDRAAEIEPSKIRPVKDRYSQPHDALQYLCTVLEKKTMVKRKGVPAPSYSFAG